MPGLTAPVDAASLQDACDRIAPPPWQAASAPAPEATGRTLFVAPGGDDRNPGTAERPFRTLARAVNSARGPGDVVLVAPGDYVEAVTLRRGGAAGRYLTVLSQTPGGARILPPRGTYSTVVIQANYVAFEGFDVQGGEGHAIEAHHVHHVRIAGNHVHDSGGSGISTGYGEYFVIEANLSRRNAATNWFHTSGISVYQARELAPERDEGAFAIVLRGNISCGNSEGPLIDGEHTDGNGIIIDDFQDIHGKNVSGPYRHRTLVENNLVFGNGGKGIQVTWSDNVTVRNNTAAFNNQDSQNPATWRGELSNAQSTGNIWVNNIAIADTGADHRNSGIGTYSYGGYVNDVVWSNNLSFSGHPGERSVTAEGSAAPGAGDNMLGRDPMLEDPLAGLFHPGPGSPALGAGTAAFGVPERDLAGRLREGAAVDLGALQPRQERPPG